MSVTNSPNSPKRVAILFPGDRASRQVATADNNRFSAVFRALVDLGLAAEPAVYQDELVEEVRSQLLRADAVLVWVNPIENGRDRSLLDAMLRDVSSRGVFVSAHPETILKMGTKQVLYDTRDVGWGSDTHVYRSMDELRRQLPEKLSRGEIRVLKQYRGTGGDGVWKVQLAMNSREASSSMPGKSSSPRLDTPLCVCHAKRGSIEQEMTLGEFLACCEHYFAGTGRIIDQAFQCRIREGMIRCYVVGTKVAGFGHQQINALYPAPPGAPASAAPQPGPRLYHPPTQQEFQSLKRILEERWIPAMQAVLRIDSDELPMIWDADFLLGEKDAFGQDTYVLCEINVSSVAPFPDSAIEPIARATLEKIQARGK